MRRLLLPALATIAMAAPAAAVGLGPLVKSGVTDGPRKAFYLTLFNPYPDRQAFTVYAVGPDSEDAQARVQLPGGPVPMRGRSSRKFIVVATALAPGETYTFRVCAEKLLDKDEPIHARVCSRLTARRIAGG